MCGIVGVAGDVSTREETIFKTMLILNQLRGHHSTGAVFVERKSKANKTVKTVQCKELGTPHEKFFQSSVFRSRMASQNRIIIGHNRYATSGRSDSIDGAHPFSFINRKTKNKYIGVHNGTLYSQNNLTDSNQFEVDSANIYYDMAARDNSLETLSKLNGAFALVWFESKTETLYMARNYHRPLHFMYNEAGDTLFFASEAWMIKQAVDRCKGVYRLDPKVHTVEINKRYGWKIPLFGKVGDITEPKEVSFVPFSRPIATNYSHASRTGIGGNRTQSHLPVVPHSDRINNIRQFNRSARASNVEHIVPRNQATGERYISRWTNWGGGPSTLETWDKDTLAYVPRFTEKDLPYCQVVYTAWPDGVPLSRGVVERVFENGCVFCGTSLSWGDMAYIHYNVGGDLALCPKCEADQGNLDIMNLRCRLNNYKYENTVYKYKEN